MGYQFSLYGHFKFDKDLPEEVLALFTEMNKCFEQGSSWYKERFNNEHICAEWCPWCYDERANELTTLQYVDELDHNYWFPAWIAWIVESICIPNGLKLNGEGEWQDDDNFDDREEHRRDRNYLPDGDGKFYVKDNFITTKGVFYGDDDWKKEVRRVNNIVKPKEVISRKPNGESKGTFCVTGKVSMSRNEFQKLGVAHGYEFKSSVTKDLTFLVCNDPNSTSSKIKNAKKNGIQVITEDEFKKILGCA